MNLIVNRACLVAALALLATVVRKLCPQPVLSCVKLLAKDRTLQIAGTDLEQSMTILVPEVQVEAPGEVLVNLDELLTTLKSSKEQAAYIRAISDQGEPQLRVTDDDAEFLLPTLPVADFPPPPTAAPGPASAEGFSIESKVLVDALDHVVWAAGEADARYSMTSLCFSFRKGKVEIAATNGRALAVVEVPVNPLGGDAEHLVHNRFAAILAKIARYSADCTDHIAVDFVPGKKNSEGMVHLYCGFVTYTASIPSPAAQTFPPYRDILAGVEGVFEFHGESAPFLSALKKAASLVSVFKPEPPHPTKT